MYMYWDIRHSPIVTGYHVHGNLVNSGDGDRDRSSKLEPSQLFSSFSVYDSSSSDTPYVLDSIQGTVMTLLPHFIQTPIF